MSYLKSFGGFNHDAIVIDDKSSEGSVIIKRSARVSAFGGKKRLARVEARGSEKRSMRSSALDSELRGNKVHVVDDTDSEDNSILNVSQNEMFNINDDIEAAEQNELIRKRETNVYDLLNLYDPTHK